MIDTWVPFLAGLLIFLSGLFKAIDKADFARSTLESGLVPSDALELFIYAFPIFELFLGGVLAMSATIHNLFGFCMRIVGAAIYLCFFIVLLVLKIKKFNGNCGCFGGVVRMTASIFHMMINFAIAIALVMSAAKVING